jgi:flagellar biosynthesis GTPase FlhF
MTSMTRQYSTAASQARSAADKTAGFWTQGARTLADWLPGLPQVDLVPAVERYFDLVQRTVDINRNLTVKWAGAVGTLSGAVRERAEPAGDAVRERAEPASDAVRQKADRAEQAAHEQASQAAREQARQAEKAEQAEKELAREARKTEREQARQAQAKARQRYQGLTKAELGDLLAERELPKSGNVDELIERLVEADSK